MLGPGPEGLTRYPRGLGVARATAHRQVLQDVPLAVTAVNADAMQNSGASDIRQLNQLAPSLLVSSTGTEANGSARIRGRPWTTWPGTRTRAGRAGERARGT